MPSFQQHLKTAERWQRFPGRERADAPGRAALTFDDGPDAEVTPALLDVLDSEDVRATFFLLGEQMMREPSLAGEVRRRGHEVALHGYEHVDHDQWWPGQTRDDLARGLGTLQASTGVSPRWYRPPYGLLSEASFKACSDLGFEPVYWSAWGYDWETISAERIAELVGRDLADGVIVLLHDSVRYAPREDAAPTIEAIPLIASHARAQGIELVTLSQAVGEG